METLGQLIFALSPVNLMETDLRTFVDCCRDDQNSDCWNLEMFWADVPLCPDIGTLSR